MRKRFNTRRRYSLVAEVRDIRRKGEKIVYEYNRGTLTLRGTRSLTEEHSYDGGGKRYIIRAAIVSGVDVKDPNAFARLDKELGLCGVVNSK